MDISNIVSDAEGSITNIAVTEANKAIANAAQEATDTATANVNSYVDGTVKPSLQTYVDQAQEDANSAATSMEQAALSATAASNYASNASADADNAAESAGLAANSAGSAATSEGNAKASETNAKIWAEGTDAQVQALGGEKSAKGWAKASTNLDYTNITNCITEIPQDIKLELNNGTLTLKAGSKVWIPYGTTEAYKVGDTDAGGHIVVATSWDGAKFFYAIVRQSDVVMPSISASTAQRMLFYNSATKSFGWNSVENCLSGTATEQVSGKLYYNTSLNRVRYNNDTAYGNHSLPICTFSAKTTANVTDSIDQVFNGFGYIGSTVFALPGVKGLIPNGRNADGSLKNIEFTIGGVKTNTSTTSNDNQWIFYDGNNLQDRAMNSERYFDENENKWYITNGYYSYCHLITVKRNKGVITSFTPKTAFHAVDYNDFILNIQEIKNSLGIEISYEG